jgi:hypothetical protein
MTPMPASSGSSPGFADAAHPIQILMVCRTAVWRNTLSQPFAVLRQVQNIGIATFGGHRIALRHGSRYSHPSGGGCKRTPNEITATTLGLGDNSLNSISTQESFWRLAQGSGHGPILVHTNSSSGITGADYIRIN